MPGLGARLGLGWEHWGCLLRGMCVLGGEDQLGGQVSTGSLATPLGIKDFIIIIFKKAWMLLL